MEWVNQFISPSKLDMFVKYKSGWEYQLGESEKEFTTEAFIDKLLKLESPDNFIKADAGSAVHKLFEMSNYGELLNAYKVNDWLITIPSDVDFNIHVPYMREISVSGVIAGITVRGRVDSMDGTKVHDIKTTGQINIDNYINSYQWKCYLLMTGLDKFVYDIIKVNVKEEIKKITLMDYVKLELYSYSNMRKDVENLISEYHDTLNILSSQIIERIYSYNSQLDILSSNLKESLMWAHTASNGIKILIDQVEQNKLKILGVTL